MKTRRGWTTRVRSRSLNNLLRYCPSAVDPTLPSIWSDAHVMCKVSEITWLVAEFLPTMPRVLVAGPFYLSVTAHVPTWSARNDTQIYNNALDEPHDLPPPSTMVPRGKMWGPCFQKLTALNKTTGCSMLGFIYNGSSNERNGRWKRQNGLRCRSGFLTFASGSRQIVAYSRPVRRHGDQNKRSKKYLNGQ